MPDLNDLPRYGYSSGAFVPLSDGPYLCFKDVIAWLNRIAPPPDACPDVDEAADAITKIVFERYDRGEGKTGGEPFRIALRAELARILASRPAREAVPEDDAEPVTEEWLRSMGFKPDGAFTDFCFARDGVIVERFADGGCEVHFGNNLYPGFETRGHIRRLCAALGLRLADPADANT